MKILLVEDDPLTRDLLVRLLRDANIEVEIAVCCREAKNRLNGLPVDAVVLDVCLPGGDGFVVLSEVRRKPGWEAIPVILMTVDWEALRVKAGADDGPVAFLPKPFEMAELLATIARITGR